MVFYWNYSVPIFLDRLVSKPQRSSCLCLLKTGIIGVRHCAQLLAWLLGVQLDLYVCIANTLLALPSF